MTDQTPGQDTGLQPLRRALLSVSDKAGLVELATALAERGVELLSTGGTAKALRDAGLAVKDVAEVTKFPEMMDGRVKTLHPKVHGGLLALRDKPDHAKAMTDHGITAIDLVCVNLYPFEKTVAQPKVTDDEAIEQIDIGGPSMIRSAAKNHRYVTCVTDPKQYDQVGNDMDTNEGATGFTLRRRLATAAFKKTSAYDNAIAAWMENR